MACSTCDHTMHGLGERWFWCPRCGTILNAENREHTVSIPSGVGHARSWLMQTRSVTSQHAIRVLTPMLLSPTERENLEDAT